jgi:hypothetical protein
MRGGSSVRAKQASAYANVRPLKTASRKNLQNLSYQNRSDVSLLNKSVQNTAVSAKLDEVNKVYIETEESVRANPIQEGEVKSVPGNIEAKTKRSGID